MSEFPHVDDAVEALIAWGVLGVMLYVIASISTVGLILAILLYAGLTIVGLLEVYNAAEGAMAAPTIFGILQLIFIICIAFGGLSEIIWGGLMLGMLLDLIALFTS